MEDPSPLPHSRTPSVSDFHSVPVYVCQQSDTKMKTEFIDLNFKLQGPQLKLFIA